MSKKVNPSKEVHKCCICGTKFMGWGNNPWGALDENGHTIHWGKNDVCCDECDAQYVIPGRIYSYAKAVKEDKKDGR